METNSSHDHLEIVPTTIFSNVDSPTGVVFSTNVTNQEPIGNTKLNERTLNFPAADAAYQALDILASVSIQASSGVDLKTPQETKISTANKNECTISKTFLQNSVPNQSDVLINSFLRNSNLPFSANLNHENPPYISPFSQSAELNFMQSPIASVATVSSSFKPIVMSRVATTMVPLTMQSKSFETNQAHKMFTTTLSNTQIIHTPSTPETPRQAKIPRIDPEVSPLVCTLPILSTISEYTELSNFPNLQNEADDLKLKNLSYFQSESTKLEKRKENSVENRNHDQDIVCRDQLICIPEEAIEDEPERMAEQNSENLFEIPLRTEHDDQIEIINNINLREKLQNHGLKQNDELSQSHVQDKNDIQLNNPDGKEKNKDEKLKVVGEECLKTNVFNLLPSTPDFENPDDGGTNFYEGPPNLYDVKSEIKRRFDEKQAELLALEGSQHEEPTKLLHHGSETQRSKRKIKRPERCETIISTHSFENVSILDAESLSVLLGETKDSIPMSRPYQPPRDKHERRGPGRPRSLRQSRKSRQHRVKNSKITDSQTEAQRREIHNDTRKFDDYLGSIVKVVVSENKKIENDFDSKKIETKRKDKNCSTSWASSASSTTSDSIASSNSPLSSVNYAENYDQDNASEGLPGLDRYENDCGDQNFLEKSESDIDSDTSESSYLSDDQVENLFLEFGVDLPQRAQFKNPSEKDEKNGSKMVVDKVLIPTTVTRDCIYFRGTLYQKGDIVSLVDCNDDCFYFAQITSLMQDQFCEKSASLDWLVPIRPTSREYFDPSAYRIGLRDFKPRKLECMSFVCHAPYDYYHSLTQQNQINSEISGSSSFEPTAGSSNQPKRTSGKTVFVGKSGQPYIWTSMKVCQLSQPVRLEDSKSNDG